MSIESLKTEPVGASALARAEKRSVSWAFIAALGASFVVAYLPTFFTARRWPWRTEQEGHGPLIMLAAAWLAWQQRDKLGLARDEARAARRLAHSHSSRFC